MEICFGPILIACQPFHRSTSQFTALHSLLFTLHSSLFTLHSYLCPAVDAFIYVSQ